MNPREIAIIGGLAAGLLLAGCGKRSEPSATPPPPTAKARPAAVPAVLPDKLKVQRNAKTYIITGIGIGGTNKVAIINGQVVKPGDKLDAGVELLDVAETYATIRHDGQTTLIRPKDLQSELDKQRP